MQGRARTPGATYRFLDCTVGQYMSREVETVTRELALREIEALFAKYDFNAFPVLEDEGASWVL